MAMRVKPDTGPVSLKHQYRVTKRSQISSPTFRHGHSSRCGCSNVGRLFQGRLTGRSRTDRWSMGQSDDPVRRREYLEQRDAATSVWRGKRGLYSDTAIQMCLTIKGLFQLLCRATEGLVMSLMRLCHLDLPVPDHTHMLRRAAELTASIPRRLRRGPTHAGPRHSECIS